MEGLTASIESALGASKKQGKEVYRAETDEEALSLVRDAAKRGNVASATVDLGAGHVGLADSVGAALAGSETPGSKWVPDSASQAQPTAELSGFDKYVKGPAEAALSMGSRMVAAPVGAVAGIAKAFTGGKYGTQEGAAEAASRASEVADALTYQPRSQGGQEAVDWVGKTFDKTKLAGLGPTEAISLSGATAGPLRVPKVGPQAAAGERTAAFGSAGSSAADPVSQARAMASGASPELQAAVEKAGPKVNLQALERHVDADTLPVPVNLTKGQATQDVALLSNEQNFRGKHEAFARRFNEQSKALKENTNAIREAAAPDVYATSAPEHGDALIHAYRTKDATLNADISKQYKALKDANGGAFPLDSKAFVDSADAALHKELLFDHVPTEIRKTLDRLRDGGSMTFENFESMRTNLARIQRAQNADGNAKAAAATVRNALEELPMPPGAEHLKPLADAARSAAKERFALIESDPAYKAVISGKASADKFIDKYVVGADLKNVQTMQSNLSHDPIAAQTIRAGTIDRLKASAGVAGDAENFSQAGYNKALEAVRPKLEVIFDAPERENLEKLGRVARYTQAQPRGSFVNNSNTFTSLAAEHAKGAAEGAVNVAAHGIPVGTWTRKIAGSIQRNREISEALKSGAGIKLKDVGR